MAVAESSRETTAGTLRNAFGNVLSFFNLLLIGVLAFSIRLFSSCFLPLSDASSFVVLYIVSSVYFSGVMVRLMLVLAPVACIMSGIALSEAFNVLTRSIKFQLPGSSETSQVDSGDTRTSTDGEQNDIANTEKVDKIVKGRPSKKNKKKENEPVERASVKS